MRVRFVVLQLDVVSGFMLFDERRFEDQCFNVAVCNDEFEVRDLSDESISLAVEWPRGTKVRAHAAAQILCFADIDHLSRRVLV